MHPLVSIIIPNYNHAFFLKKRLDSIFQQTYENVEIILLDDNSTDESSFILKKHQQHPKVSHYIVNKINSGSPFKQWKKGINLAKGKYIWIAESDDWASPILLEKLVSQLEIDNDLALAYCQSIVVDKNGKKQYSMLNWTDNFKRNQWKKAYINLGDQEIKKYLINRNTIPNASAVVFRNNKEINDFVNENMTMVGDWWFWVNIIKNKKLAFIPDELNFFRRHDNNSSSNLNFDKKIKNILERNSVLNLIHSLFPLEVSLINQHERQLIHDAILWFPPFDYRKIRTFLNETFNLSMPFHYFVLQAYLYWVLNRLKGIKRRSKRLKRRL